MEETHNETREAARPARIENIASWLIMATAFLAPIFFIPSGLYSIPFAKSAIIYVGVIASLVAFLFSILERGSLRLPGNKLYYAAFLIPLVFLIASLASPSVTMSLAGYGAEVGTFAFIMLMFAFLFLVTQLVKTREKVFYSYLLFLLSFGIVTLFQLARFAFGPSALSFGLFTSAVSNLIGSWNDMGVFFAASALLALVTLEMLTLSRKFKILLYVAFGLSLALLAVVNFSTVWYVLAAFALVFFVYILLTSRTRRNAEGEGEAARPPLGRISYLSLGLLAFSLLFVFAGGIIGGWIADTLRVSNIEVRPSWGTTWDITMNTFGKRPIFGSGPNTFQYEWVKNKPEGINTTAFWNTDFSYGIGLIPTFFVTTGVAGMLAWLLFLLSYAYVGLRAIFTGIHDQVSRYFVLSSFLVSLFLWVAAIIYVPSVTMFALTFFFTGLFLASAYNEGLLPSKEVQLYKNAKLGFVSVLALVFALILSIGAGYYMVRNFVSSVYFQKSLKAATTSNNVPLAEKYMLEAARLRGYDIYYRSLAEIKMLKLSDILSKQNEPVENLRTQFQQVLGEAINAGMKAVGANGSNYLNYVELGRIYESVVPQPFKIEGAYQKAKESYEKALALNPTSPDINLLLGRLEIANGNLDAARERITKALELKPNYVDGYYLLSQVEVSAGNLKKAITSTESATFLAPDNAGVYFQLGLLRYSDSNWNGAIQAFERAITLVPDYANAKYFLGLSYAKVGRGAEAIKQFDDLKATNPDNQEITLILGNLKAGRDPFAGAKPPVDNTPEKRENPPVKQR